MKKLIVFNKIFRSVNNIPFYRNFNKKFYCSALDIQLGENVGLAVTMILAYALVYIGNNCPFSFRNAIIPSSHFFNDL